MADRHPCNLNFTTLGGSVWQHSWGSMWKRKSSRHSGGWFHCLCAYLLSELFCCSVSKKAAQREHAARISSFAKEQQGNHSWWLCSPPLPSLSFPISSSPPETNSCLNFFFPVSLVVRSFNFPEWLTVYFPCLMCPYVGQWPSWERINV